MEKYFAVTAVVLSLTFCASFAQISDGTPSQDLDIVMDEGIQYANTMLEKKSEVFPFVVVMADDGQIRFVAVTPNENSALESVLENLREEAAEAGLIRAVAAFSLVRFPNPSTRKKEDMVRIGREHVTGNCSEFYLPYVPGLEKIGSSDRVLLVPDSTGKIFSNCN